MEGKCFINLNYLSSKIRKFYQVKVRYLSHIVILVPFTVIVEAIVMFYILQIYFFDYRAQIYLEKTKKDDDV